MSKPTRQKRVAFVARYPFLLIFRELRTFYAYYAVEPDDLRFMKNYIIDEQDWNLRPKGRRFQYCRLQILKEKAPEKVLLVAGAGLEPATSGL